MIDSKPLYRDSRTGLEGRFGAHLARHFPDLELVDEEAVADDVTEPAEVDSPEPDFVLTTPAPTD